MRVTSMVFAENHVLPYYAAICNKAAAQNYPQVGAGHDQSFHAVPGCNTAVKKRPRRWPFRQPEELIATKAVMYKPETK
jgi:hypothetical protein